MIMKTRRLIVDLLMLATLVLESVNSNHILGKCSVCLFTLLAMARSNMLNVAVETYKILTGKYYMVAVPNLSIATAGITRGNDLILQKNRTRYDLHKFFFTNRVVV